MEALDISMQLFAFVTYIKVYTKRSVVIHIYLQLSKFRQISALDVY